MAPADNAYSQFVSLAKVLLPLVALAILSTLFLFSRGGAPTSDIPFAEIEDIARDPRITGAAYAGVAPDGSLISVETETMRPDGGLRTFAVEGLTARIDTPEGIRTEILARAGQLDTEGKIARVTGLARIETSTGYQMETTGIEADLATGTIRTLGPLEARAPFGSLTAGNLVVENPTDGSGARMVFSEGVSLVYTPEP